MSNDHKCIDVQKLLEFGQIKKRIQQLLEDNNQDRKMLPKKINEANTIFEEGMVLLTDTQKNLEDLEKSLSEEIDSKKREEKRKYIEEQKEKIKENQKVLENFQEKFLKLPEELEAQKEKLEELEKKLEEEKRKYIEERNEVLYSDFSSLIFSFCRIFSINGIESIRDLTDPSLEDIRNIISEMHDIIGNNPGDLSSSDVILSDGKINLALLILDMLFTSIENNNEIDYFLHSRRLRELLFGKINKKG